MKTSNSTNGSVKQWRRYQHRKPVELDWCHEIPNHWTVAALKRFARFQSGDGITSLEIEPEGDFPVYGGNGLRGYSSKYTHDGDFVLLGRQGALCGNVNYASGRFWASEHAVVVTTSKAICLRWYGELLRAMNLGRYSMSAAQPGLSVQFVVNLLVPIPPLDEQRHIVKFLDRETAKIDTLIAKKEQLIELLQEKRSALISHAVTKGLDPTVQIKDSGVAWLGKIPAHWDTVRLARFVGKIEQGWSPQADDRKADDGEWAVTKLGAVFKGQFRSSEHKAMPAELSAETRYEVRAGDFLVTRANTQDLVGDVCVVENPRPKLMLCDLIYRVQVDEQKVVKQYLAFCLLSRLGRYQITREARGASQSMVKISQGHIRSFVIVLPDVGEQARIVEFIDLETRKVGTLIAKIREAIDKLHEYRTALISAAVTGKIDVREGVV